MYTKSMQDSSTIQVFTNVHFPQRISLIKNLRYFSFLINDMVLIGSGIIFFGWLITIPSLKDFLFQKLAVIPSSAIPFILLGTSLFFGAKRHIPNANEQSEIHYPWWSTLIPILLASSASLLGLTSFLVLDNNVPIISAVHMPSIVGLCFFLIGIALIPPFTRIPHRFHITQLLIFVVSGLSMFVVFENIYQIISGVKLQQTIFFPFSLALTFAFFCFGILLRWSNRGFFGNFTLDSTGSRFSLRILLVNLIITPLISIITLVVFPIASRNAHQLLNIVVIFFTFASSLLIWINLKLLYPYELEHLLMRESLRAHNIDLTKEEETLKKKMTEIEQEKQQYKSELNIQSGWRNAIDNSE